MIGLYVCLFFAVYWPFMMLRSRVAYRACAKAIEIDVYAYEHGPSYDVMTLQVWKWSFRQFYPELAARGQS